MSFHTHAGRNDAHRGISSKKIAFKVLMDAILTRNLTRVRQAVVNGVDLTQRDEIGRPPLYLAVKYHQLDIVDELCTAESINVPDNYGRSPLLLALDCRKPEIVNVLLAQEGIDVNKADTHSGATPLCLAAHGGDFEIVKALLKNRHIDVNLASVQGTTPLIVAVRNSHLDVVAALLDADADVNKSDNRGLTPLHAATYAVYGKYEKARLLLRHDANPNTQHAGRVPLHEFAFFGDIRTACLLIAAGADLYELSEPHQPVIEGVLKRICTNRSFMRSDTVDTAVLFYVALDDHHLSMQSIQRVEDEFGEWSLLKTLRSKLNDEEIVADMKKQLIAEKSNWIMHELNGQNRIVDVVMALKPLQWPALVFVELLMFDSPRLSEIPFHVVSNLTEKIIRC